MSIEILECKEVKTNKDHRCEWCPEIIKKGERARYRKYVFEGRFVRARPGGEGRLPGGG